MYRNNNIGTIDNANRLNSLNQRVDSGNVSHVNINDKNSRNNDLNHPSRPNNNSNTRSRVFLEGHMLIEKTNGTQKIVCAYCSKTWPAPKTSSTGNYRKHLLKHHPYELSEYNGCIGQVKLKEGLLQWMLGNQVSIPIGMESINDDFVNLVQNVFQIVIGKSKLSSLIGEALKNQYRLSKEKLCDYFKIPPVIDIAVKRSGLLSPTVIDSNFYAVSFHIISIDALNHSNSLIPSSPNTSHSRNFISISVHFINENWLLKEILLGFKSIYGNPSSKIISDILCTSLTQYFDVSKISCIVSRSTDNYEILSNIQRLNRACLLQTDMNTFGKLLPQYQQQNPHYSTQTQHISSPQQYQTLQRSISTLTNYHPFSKYRIFCVGSMFLTLINDVISKLINVSSVFRLRSLVDNILSSPEYLKSIASIHYQQYLNVSHDSNNSSFQSHYQVHHNPTQNQSHQEMIIQNSDEQGELSLNSSRIESCVHNPLGFQSGDQSLYNSQHQHYVAITHRNLSVSTLHNVTQNSIENLELNMNQLHSSNQPIRSAVQADAFQSHFENLNDNMLQGHRNISHYSNQSQGYSSDSSNEVSVKNIGQSSNVQNSESHHNSHQSQNQVSQQPLALPLNIYLRRNTANHPHSVEFFPQNIPEYIPISLDNPNVTWRSTLNMLNSAIQQRQILDTFIRECIIEHQNITQQQQESGLPFFNQVFHHLSDDDWNELISLSQLLNSFETVMTSLCLSDVNSATLPTVLPSFNWLLEILDDQIEQFSKYASVNIPSLTSKNSSISDGNSSINNTNNITVSDRLVNTANGHDSSFTVNLNNSNLNISASPDNNYNDFGSNNSFCKFHEILVFYNATKEKLSDLFKAIKSSIIYSIAALLDPRLKMDIFNDGNWTLNEKNFVLSELHNIFMFYLHPKKDSIKCVNEPNEFVCNNFNSSNINQSNSHLVISEENNHQLRHLNSNSLLNPNSSQFSISLAESRSNMISHSLVNNSDEEHKSNNHVTISGSRLFHLTERDMPASAHIPGTIGSSIASSLVNARSIDLNAIMPLNILPEDVDLNLGSMQAESSGLETHDDATNSSSVDEGMIEGSNTSTVGDSPMLLSQGASVRNFIDYSSECNHVCEASIQVSLEDNEKMIPSPNISRPMSSIYSASTPSNNFFKRRKSNNENQRTELEVFIASPVSVNYSQSPLSWWKEHSSSYPVLSRLVKDLYGIVSSVNFSESQSNTGIDMISRLRRFKSMRKMSSVINVNKISSLGRETPSSIPSQGYNNAGIRSNSISQSNTSIKDEDDESSVDYILSLRSWIQSILGNLESITDDVTVSD